MVEESYHSIYGVFVTETYFLRPLLLIHSYLYTSIYCDLEDSSPKSVLNYPLCLAENHATPFFLCSHTKIPPNSHGQREGGTEESSSSDYTQTASQNLWLSNTAGQPFSRLQQSPSFPQSGGLPPIGINAVILFTGIRLEQVLR